MQHRESKLRESFDQFLKEQLVKLHVPMIVLHPQSQMSRGVSDREYELAAKLQLTHDAQLHLLHFD